MEWRFVLFYIIILVVAVFFVGSVSYKTISDFFNTSANLDLRKECEIWRSHGCVTPKGEHYIPEKLMDNVPDECGDISKYDKCMKYCEKLGTNMNFCSGVF